MTSIDRKNSRLLPKIFNTSTNLKFLNATLDQLTEAETIIPVDGFLGRKWTGNAKRSDNYLNSTTALRSAYQLEPSVILRDASGTVEFVATYDDLITKLNYYDVPINNHSRLFTTENYTYAPPINFDKLINYSQYYWMPNGPDAVTINETFNLDDDVIGQTSYTTEAGIVLMNGMKVTFGDKVTPTTYQNIEYLVHGVGTSIFLTPWSDYITPEKYVENAPNNFDEDGFDNGGMDETINRPEIPDYITIQRGSGNGNAWSRTNRWFHINVIEYTATLNDTTSTVSFDQRAQRPIIEFDRDLKLFNFGTTKKTPVDLIDKVNRDVLSTYEGRSGIYIDGVLVVPGMRIIFAADTDVDYVRNRVFVTSEVLVNDQKVIHFELADDAQPVTGESVVASRGNTYGGVTWNYDGSEWVVSQTKSAINQAPLFDLFDKDGVSLSNSTTYPSNNFLGNPIFGYASGSVTDEVLGFKIKYKSYNNIGDVVFENSLVGGSYTYTVNNEILTVEAGKSFLKSVTNGVTTYLNNWKKPLEKTKQALILDTYADGTTQTWEFSPVPAAQIQRATTRVYIDGVIQFVGKDYDIASVSSTVSSIQFATIPKADAHIVIKVISDQTSDTAFYEIPDNLARNAKFGSVIELTLGQLRDHAVTAIESVTLTGSFPGRSNVSEIGEYQHLANQIIRPVTNLNKASYLLINEQTNFINAIRWVRHEYSRFKQKFLVAAERLDLKGTISQKVDQILTDIASNRQGQTKWSLSDMAPSQGPTKSNTYTVENVDFKTYDLELEYDLTKNVGQAVLIYKNGVILVRGRDYDFSNSLQVTLTTTLAKNDKLIINEWKSTANTAIPPTPSKLGLYPSFQPRIFNDDTLLEPTDVILGHDGSIVPAFGDFRDDLLFEMEARIYNNIKTEYNSDVFDIVEKTPGRFRKTAFSRKEFNQVLLTEFLTWAGHTQIEFADNTTFENSNGFSWNYNPFRDSIDKSELPGSWRAMYLYFFDTDAPNSRPWEMLGFAYEPDWWESEYGTAPYTRGNLLLWQDLADGRIKQGDREGYDLRYARPQLLDMIPVDDQGNLLPPLDAGLVGQVRPGDLDEAWQAGDGGPVETAWRRNSEYPFAFVQTMALLHPSEFFDLCWDPSLVTRNLVDQVVDTVNNKPLDATALEFSTRSRIGTGYHMWLYEYAISKQMDPTETVLDVLNNLEVNLASKLSGYTDENKLLAYLEKSNPSSSNTTTQIPPEDMQLINHSSIAENKLIYSGVIVERTSSGYQVMGYDSSYPNFRILRANENGNYSTVSVGEAKEDFFRYDANTTYGVGAIIQKDGKYFRVLQEFSGELNKNNVVSLAQLPTRGGKTAKLYREFYTDVVNIPYGTEFDQPEQVFEFLIAYGKWLESQGWVFDYSIPEVNQVSNWIFSGKEFLFWSMQRWAPGTIITLSPGAVQLKLALQLGTAIDHRTISGSFYINDRSGNPIADKFIAINKQDGLTTIKVDTDRTEMYAVKLANIIREQVLVLNNETVFSDLLYDPLTGLRQDRIKIKGYIGAGWDGQIGARGFFYDEARIDDWFSYTTYDSGSLVRYLNKVWTNQAKHTSGATFDFNQWVEVGKVDSKLHRNWTGKVQAIETAYNLDATSTPTDIELLAAQQLGYSSKNYLDTLVQNERSQIKFYQGVIKQKGTMSSIDALLKAKLQDAEQDVQVSEEWAVRVGAYGAIDNTKTLELILPEADVKAKNQIIEFSDTTYSSVDSALGGVVMGTSDSRILSKPENWSAEVWRTTDDSDLIETLTAGYVKLDDVDYTLIDINNLEELSAKVDSLGIGQTVWIAFGKNREWDVQRITGTEIVPVSIKRISDSVAEITTNTAHGFADDQLVVLKNFYPEAKGIFKVLRSRRPTSFQVELKIQDTTRDPVQGTLFTMVSVRYADVTDLINNEPRRGWETDNHVWVDSFEGSWASLKRTRPFSDVSRRIGTTLEDSLMSTSLVASDDNHVVVAGAPGIDGGEGGLIVYRRSQQNPSLGFNDTLEEFIRITQSETFSVVGMGSSLALADPSNISMVTGAPLSTDSYSAQGTAFFIERNVSGQFEITQTVTCSTEAVNGHFGTAVATSKPTDMTQRVEWSEVSSVFRYAFTEQEYWKLTEASTVLVIQAGIILEETVDYSFDDDTREIVLVNSPNTDDQLLVICDPIFAAISAPGQNITDIYIYTDENTPWRFLQAILPGDQITGDHIGSSLSFDEDGSHLAIGAPDKSTSSVYIWRRNGTKYNNLAFAQQVKLSDDSLTRFGCSVALNTDASRLVVGVEESSEFANLAGAVKSYVQSGGTWSLDATLKSREVTPNARFGQTIALSRDGVSLAVTSKFQSVRLEATFDEGEMTFDAKSTEFSDTEANSGRVEVFALYDGLWAYEQDLVQAGITTNDEYGSSIYGGADAFYIGAPRDDYDTTDSGAFYEYGNNSGDRAWQVVSANSDVVDINQFGKKFLWSQEKNQIIDFIDFLDPAKGKLPSIADQELSYKNVEDPASYTKPMGGRKSNSRIWGSAQVGNLWLDYSTIKWIWYEQGSLEYRKKNWAKVFPGMTPEVLEWVESSVPPEGWSGTTQEGTPRIGAATPYSIESRFDISSQTFKTKYYFWVKNRSILPDIASRRLSAVDVSQMIENPDLSGTTLSFIRNDVVVLNNIKSYLNSSDTVLHIEYQNKPTDGVIHTEWQLISEDSEKILTEPLVKKMIDTLAGVDELGSLVPDPSLPATKKIGYAIRPRQALVNDNQALLDKIITYVNEQFALTEIANERDITGLEISEASPSEISNEWDEQIDNETQLDYITTNGITAGYKVLVNADSTISDRWSIYRWNGTEWIKIREQSWNVKNYWRYVDWWKTGYEEETTSINYTVDTYPDLIRGSYEENDVIRVTRGLGGGLQTYIYSDGEFIKVHEQNGTIEFVPALYDYESALYGFDSGGFGENAWDSAPSTETRKIFEFFRDDLLKDDLTYIWNRIIMMVIYGTLAEQGYVDWVFKTSFISINQRVRQLSQPPFFVRDNQDYLTDYISEVKPYHTKIRDVKLRYDAIDIAQNYNTDFDLPVFWDEVTKSYKHPKLNDEATQAKMDESPWRDWRLNYGKYVSEIVVTNGGSGYLNEPLVTIQSSNDEGNGATAKAIVSGGRVSSILVLTEGKGYTAAPEVIIGAGGETNATAYAVLENDLVRDMIVKIKFDRITGDADVQGRNIELAATVGSDGYTFSGLVKTNPILVLERGNHYRFTSSDDSDPIIICLSKDPANISPYQENVTGTIPAVASYLEITPTDTTPDVLFYKSVNNPSTHYGKIVIVDTSMLSTSYYGTGVQTTFDLPENKYFHEDGFVKVSNRLVELDVDYTVSEDGTYITFTTAPALGAKVEIFATLDGESIDYHAADRILTYYKPTAGMLPNDPVKLMKGLEYPNAQVKGLKFGDTPLFGSGGYDTGLFDSVELDENGVPVLGSRSGVDFDLRGGGFNTEFGVSPEEIHIKGDGFVTPSTSYAPEEVVPGQTFDTLNMMVYTSSGSSGRNPEIILKNFIAQAGVTRYQLDRKPVSNESVWVHINRIAMNNPTVYTIDFDTNEIVFASAPTAGTLIQTTMMDMSSDSMIGYYTFTGTGTSALFDTGVDFATAVQAYVTVDGESMNFTINNQNGYAQIQTTSTPSLGAIVQVWLFSGSTTPRAFTKTSIVEYQAPAAPVWPTDYRLVYDENIANLGPSAARVFVERSGVLLTPPDIAYYEGDGSTTVFALPDNPGYTLAEISAGDIRVYVAGIRLLSGVHYTWSGTDDVTLNTAPADGEVVTIALDTYADYVVGDNLVQIKESVVLQPNELLKAYTFTNHDYVDMTTEVFKGTNSFTVLGYDEDTFDNLPFDNAYTGSPVGGRFVLANPITHNDYVWVTVNGQKLRNGIDFIIEEGGIAIQIGSEFALSDTDRVVISTFGSNVAQKPIGYRIFFDMRGNKSYLRISERHTTYLTRDHTLSDTQIDVVDGSKLPVPDPSKGRPGVIFVQGERIEYYIVDGNSLKQIRRGTWGTGAAETLYQGAKVVDGSRAQSIPGYDGTKVLYDQGDTTAADGTGLLNSTNAWAKFLKDTSTTLPSYSGT